MIHQYDSKGVTAVVDRCVRIQHTYGNIPLNLTHPWYHSIPKSLICCCSGPRLVHAALAMHAILAALGTIFQAYPALCPCEPRRPLGDMQAVSCGARSRQYSRLLPASSSQPRSIVERAGSGPMGRVRIYIIYTYIYIYISISLYLYDI